MQQQSMSTAAVLARMEAHNPGTVGFKGTEAEQRRWNRAVKLNAMAVAPQSATVIPFPGRASRPRERRAQSARSSARSGDSGSDSDPEPAQLWRWQQPSSWLNLVRSVWTYDVGRELAAERDRGWLPGHGDVETAAAPVVPGRREDRWIAGTF